MKLYALLINGYISSHPKGRDETRSFGSGRGGDYYTKNLSWHNNNKRHEILKCWIKVVDKVMILPIVIGALGIVKNNLRKNLDKVDLHLGVDVLQKICLLRTARIIRKVFDTK